MGNIRVDLTDGEVDLQDVRVGVADGEISFAALGVIRGVSDETIEHLSGGTCVPTAVEFLCE